MGEASGDPFDVSGFLVEFCGGFASSVAAEIEVGDGYDEMWGFVFVARESGARGEADFGDADTVLGEEDFLRGANGRDKLDGWRVGVVVQEFDGDIAEGLLGKIVRGVGEASHEEAGIAVFEFELDRRFGRDCVFDFTVAQSDEDVVVVVAVDQGLGVWGDFDFEDTDVFVFQNEVVGGFGGDGDCGGGCGLGYG